jgi:hypothetical protein
MKISKPLFSIVIILISIACVRKENLPNFGVNCDLLKTGIINYDQSSVRTEISKLTADLTPISIAGDTFGQLNNLDKLIDRISKCGNVTAELRCYACIETYPEQSEIILKTDSSGIQIQRVMDISTSNKEPLKFGGLHLSY